MHKKMLTCLQGLSKLVHGECGCIHGSAVETGEIVEIFIGQVGFHHLLDQPGLLNTYITFKDFLTTKRVVIWVT